MNTSFITRSLLALSIAALPMLADARTEADFSPVYSEGGQYTAVLHSDSQLWQLSPLSGEQLEVRGDALCPRTAVPPKGLWVLGRDAEGRAELIAPSATLLPEGHSGRVALRACDDPALRDASVQAYGVPQPLLDLLAANTGAVLVAD